MDPDTESLLVSTCLAIGGFEDRSENVEDTTQVYVMGDECLECLKDIKKFIKYYDEPGDNVVLTFLGRMGILEKDLIPIMLLNTPADNSTKERLVLACIELMVPMTWIIDYKALQEMASNEEDDSLVGNLHQRTETLRAYKKGFLQPGVLTAVFGVLMKPLRVEYRMRTTRDQAIIRLGLSLFRNLVAIQDSESSITGTMDQFISSIMQEELLERFQQENIMALLVALASSAKDPQLAEWNAITLEIFYYVFTGVDADDLIPAITGGVKNPQLQDLLNKEEQERKSQSTAGRKRHDRFGTTGEVRLEDGTRIVLHQKGALFSSFETQMDTFKKAKAKPKRKKEKDEYRKNITKSGSTMLRNLAMTLLESCFNPLFGSLRQDVEMEREKIKEHHRGQYHYLMAFLLQFQRQYAEYLTKQHNEHKKTAHARQLQNLESEYQKNMLQCDFDLVATAIEVPCVFQTIQFIRRKMEEKDKDKRWDEIRRAMDCIQEMLMTLYAMTKSPKEEYRDASDYVQNNLYYEDATLELFLDLVKTYKTQSAKYLNTLVPMIHILLKTLESYSKSKSFMAVLKKRAIGERKDAEKKKTEEVAEKANGQQGGVVADGENQDPQSEDGAVVTEGQSQVQEQEDEAYDDHITYTLKEHTFAFKEYERRFANERVVQTYCAFLESFEDLDETQLHWIASMFYRIAVHCGNKAVFYKLSVMNLFHRIMDRGKENTKQDMIPFVVYVMHEYAKLFDKYRLLMQEVIFPKTSKVCLEINVGRDEAEKEQRAMTERKEKRLMATELQVDPNRPESEQIKIAVMALIDEDKEDLILKDAVAKRQLMTFRSERELQENPDLMYSIENVEDIVIVANTPARQKAIRVEPRFRLLFKLIKFTKEEVDDIQYKIPKDLPTDTIAEYQEMIEAVLAEAPESNQAYDFAALIQKIKKTKPPSGNSRRRAGVNGEEGIEKEMPVYHSAEYVIDSGEEDEEYFEAEKHLRERKNIDFAQAEARHRKMEEENARAKSKKHKALLMRKIGKGKDVSLTDDVDDDGIAIESEDRQPLPKVVSDMDSDSDVEGNSFQRPPPKSTGDVESDSDNQRNSRATSSRSVPVSQQQYQGRQVLLSDDSDGDEQEDQEATQPLSLTQRLARMTTNKRRIILDDSDDDEAVQSDNGGQGSDDRPQKKKFAFEE
ncbi:Topoisomerase 1-associated factor 1 [Mortierella polycephala]|uniref:Topoisomerase 1-associated factor 1 n=1 Tax=Mortierella polycephala TaxID=41804 RepID=A0A9P6U407_9FUNG|nr:Topoisomerase 1-associated factor 1 [Mortierella polycephala]